MPKNPKEGSHIKLPWEESSTPTGVVRCPKCHNDGMDGSITGFSGTWGISRKCIKCGNSWQGGIGIQIADFSETPAIPNVERKEDPPLVQYTGGQYRDPNKNHSGEDS